ncbi:Pentatricopeptide repeat-containing protein 5, mitochondrial [Rhodotorula toruloides]|nr:Pentatricopeptide repeat-containing protein 5, mitochondrial [Rhodotorula toruloides]
MKGSVRVRLTSAAYSSRLEQRTLRHASWTTVPKSSRPDRGSQTSNGPAVGLSAFPSSSTSRRLSLPSRTSLAFLSSVPRSLHTLALVAQSAHSPKPEPPSVPSSSNDQSKRAITVNPKGSRGKSRSESTRPPSRQISQPAPTGPPRSQRTDTSGESAASAVDFDAQYRARRRERAIQGLDTRQVQAYDEIDEALKGGDISVLERAVQQYQADPSKWSTPAHEWAMLSLARLRRPLQPVDSIIHLHADFANSDRLAPSRTAHEVVIEALCARDREHLRQIRWLEARGARRPHIAAARGPWRHAVSSSEEDVFSRNERDALAQLHQRNFFQQALFYYAELGAAAEDLSLSVHEALIEGAAARGELEGTLSLFGRLEEHRRYRPGWRSHVALIHLYAKQENSADLIKDIFESYLKGRANGDIKAPAREYFRRTWLPPKPIRHNSSTEPVFRPESLMYINNGDEEVWGETVRELAEIGDMAGAVAIVEKLIEARRSKQRAPVGYPKLIAPETWGTLAATFAVQGDHASAIAWFDRLVSGTAPAVFDPRGRLSVAALLTALRSNDVAFVNHVYRHMLAQSHKAPLSSAQLARVIDFNLAHAAKADDPVERNALFDTVLEFRRAFRQGVKDGHEDGVGIANDRSTGFLGRMASAFGSFGRFEEATSTFVALAKIVRRVMTSSTTMGGPEPVAWTRTARKWAFALTDDASGSLGFVPLAKHDTKDKTIHGLTRLVSERPSLRQAVTVVGLTSQIRTLGGLAPVADHVLTVAEAYSAARASIDREAQLGQLSGADWRVVLECAAYTAAFLGRGIVVDFSFPGFDAVFDDFLASGVHLPRSGSLDFDAFTEALTIAGVSESRINQIASVLQQKIAEDPVEGVKRPQSPPSSKTPKRKVGEATPASLANDADGHSDQGSATTGAAPSAETYEAKIAKVDVTDGDARTAVTLFEEGLRLGVRPTASLFNTLLSKLAKARQAKQAFDYFELMKQYEVRPTPLTYGIVINMCCNVGDDSTATFLFKDMCALPGFEPRAPPYNTMMQFYTRTKPDRERAFFYWQRLQQDKVQPTAETYQCLLDAYGTIAPPLLDQTQRIFAQLVEAEGIAVSSSHWASLIRAYGVLGKDLERAQAIFESIKEHATTLSNPNRRLPDAVIYEAILDSCTANKRYDLVDEYLVRMREEGVPVAASLADSLFKGFIDNKQYELVDRYLDRMRSDGINLSANVAEELLRSCIASKRFDLVDYYLERMRSDNLRLPDSVLEPLLYACIVGERSELVGHYLERLHRDGVSIPARTAVSLIKTCTEQGAFEHARRIFKAIQSPPSVANDNASSHQDGKPAYRDPSTYEAMLRCELAANEPFKAIEVYNRAQQRDLPPTIVARLRGLLEAAGIQLLSLD